MSRFIAFALGLLLFLCSALAGNADDVLIGNDATLMAGAQTASCRSGAALHYNPAGLADAPDQSVDVSLSAYSLRLHSVAGLVTTPTE